MSHASPEAIGRSGKVVCPFLGQLHLGLKQMRVIEMMCFCSSAAFEHLHLTNNSYVKMHASIAPMWLPLISGYTA